MDGPLDSATAMAFTPDGRLLLTERATGNIRVFADGQLQATPWATIAVHSGGLWAEAGLIGIAVDPDFLNNGYVYVYYTAPGGTENSIARLQEQNGVGTNLTVLTQSGDIAGALYHNAGTMTFGHDGHLYVATGDALGAAWAQNTASLRGKILRYEVPNLTVPASNPFGNPVWSYGHRNTFGLAVHPVSGDIYQTENGGSWMDEVNHIVGGGNYGWPIYEGQETTPDPSLVDPLSFYHPTSAPTGCCFYTGEHYPATYKNAWFFTNYNHNELRALWLDPTGNFVVNQTIFDDLPGAGYSVLTGPDGNLWYLTNDTGGYGADELGRYVHQNEAFPSVQISSVSNKTLGASMTICVRGQNGAVAVPWLSLNRFAAPVATPLGNWWVPGDASLETMYINTDDRAYMGLSVPNAPVFLGSSIHCQAMMLDAQQQLTLTNPSELIIRG
ncbi:MAG: PQQ-dependent sugar dehydrogenase [Planctomycetes bacterium]|nr:PQQ-dependent sugar dehydrogenase [Planctomycetota bacterium]